MALRVLFTVLLVQPLLAQRSAPESLDFLHGLSEYEHIQDMLPSYIEQRAQVLVEARKHSLHLSTMEEVARRRQYVRERMLHDLGGLPERTPLNPRTVGVVEREGYRIEKIVFESQPHFYVTANLYLPKTGQPPYPAILYPLGHELGAKANAIWQQNLVELARRGYVAMTWDTLGQGERVQQYDEDFQDAKLRASTTEHTVLGIQCLLTGQHIARYTIWDATRALDYLLSRKEVDARHVAATGNSGGGTHTAYMAALDDRIQVAAPSCYITSWHWMLKTLGPQDAEQVFPNWLKDGLDYPDFLYAFAPKPYRMLSAIRDFFPIDGARESFREAQQVYAALGAAEKIGMVEADDGHGYSHPRRMAGYAWFGRWLKGTEDHAPEREITPETAETLQCTPTGQVATSLGGETVYSINRKRAEELRRHRPKPESAAALAAFQQRIRRAAEERTGWQRPSGPVSVTPYGVIRRTGYRIEKLTYESEPGILIPALLYVPDGTAARRPAVILVDGRGKSASAPDQEQLAQGGTVVLSVDLRGMGETRSRLDVNASDFARYFGDYEDAMTAILMGQSMVGMRARDILRGLDLLAARPEVDQEKIGGLGRNTAAVPMLYAAAFDPRLKSLALENMLLSYDAVVTHRIHRQVFENIVPAALQDYDLPELVAALAPRPVWILDPVTPMGNPVLAGDRQSAYAVAARAYQIGGAAESLRWQPVRASGEDAAGFYQRLFR